MFLCYKGLQSFYKTIYMLFRLANLANKTFFVDLHCSSFKYTLNNDYKHTRC